MATSVREADARHPTAFPTTSGRIARMSIALARKKGLDLDEILKAVRVTQQEIDGRNLRLPVRSQIKLLALIAAALPDPFLGFHLAQAFEARELGLLYYTLASSATLGDALGRAARYSTIVNEGVALRYIEGEDLTILLDYVNVPRHSDRQQIEFFVTALIHCSRDLARRRVVPSRVQLMHHHHESQAEMNRYFGRDVEFGAPRDAVVLERKVMDLPLVGADPYLNDLMVRFSEEALAARPAVSRSLRSAVENAIAPLLPHGRPRLPEIARSLGMSERTLARRLQVEGLRFTDILEQLRADLARRHITDLRLSVSQIAWLLGYQEISAFTHAFKRWTGTTPMAMRLRRNDGSS